jgi:molybdate transport system ATP-binding protein
MSTRPLVLDVAIRQGGFTLELQWSGELGILGLFGPSGAGKTTLLEGIAGLRRLTRGRIVFDGRVFDDALRRHFVPARARAVGYAPQDAALFPHLSVKANVEYGAARAADHPMHEVFALLEIETLIDRDVAGLSGGERQRVAVARALLSGPSLLLLDEPLSAVDVARRRRILPRLVDWCRGRALPMVLVSHDESELTAADTVLILT